MLLSFKKVLLNCYYLDLAASRVADMGASLWLRRSSYDCDKKKKLRAMCELTATDRCLKCSFVFYGQPSLRTFRVCGFHRFDVTPPHQAKHNDISPFSFRNNFVLHSQYNSPNQNNQTTFNSISLLILNPPQRKSRLGHLLSYVKAWAQ
jgi:hypothetical protein